MDCDRFPIALNGNILERCGGIFSDCATKGMAQACPIVVADD
jgi:hypothetical protein